MFNTKPWNAGFPGIPKEIEELQKKDISMQSQINVLESRGYYAYGQERPAGSWGTLSLYRMMKSFGAAPNATSKSVSTNLTNVGYRFIQAFASNDNELIPIPNKDFDVALNKANNEVTITTTADKSAYTIYYNLWYTKDTTAKEPEKEPEEVKEPETKTTKKAKKGE